MSAFFGPLTAGEQASEDTAGPKSAFIDLAAKADAFTNAAPAAGTPWWGDNPRQYDTVVLGGMPLPGICRLVGWCYKQRLNRKKSPGVDGEEQTHVGLDAAEFDIEIQMWMPAHWRDIQDIVPILRRPRTVRTKAAPLGGTASAAPASAGDWDPTAFAFPWNQPGPQLADGLHQGIGKAVPDTNILIVTGNGTPPEVAATNAKPKPPTSVQVPPIFNIYHPLLAAFQITQVNIIEIGLPEVKAHDNGDHYVMKIKVIEVMRQKQGVVAAPVPRGSNITSLGRGQVGRRVDTFNAQQHQQPPPSQTAVQPKAGP